MPIPREPCEGPIDGKVMSATSKDYTEEMIKGAHEVLKFAQAIGATEFIGTKSPSCSVGQIYDGTFSNNFISGDGVTTALLKKHGIKTISVEEI